MLSLGTWLQIALLSGYQEKQVARAAHSAVTRALATSPNTPAQTLRFMYSLLPHLPMPHCCHLTFCAAWICHQAHWAGDKYSSWFSLLPYLQMGFQDIGALIGSSYSPMPPQCATLTTCVHSGRMCV